MSTPPPTLAEIEREALVRQCARDKDTRDLTLEMSRRDVVFWVQNFVWTFDPRLSASTRILPLFPYPKQIEFLKWLEVREETRTGGVVCKGRGTGITWLCVAFAVHRWLFQRGYVATFGSRREDLVDRLGSMDAILPKARFLIERLPPWMIPPGFKMERDAPFMRIINPLNRAIIAGETGDQIGRGGRSSLLVIDEAAFVPRLAQVFAAASENTEVEIDVSTPGMPGDPFDQRCDRPDIYPLFDIDWRDDPRKTEEWATRTREQLGYMVFAREYERDRKISLEGLVCQPTWIQAAQRVRRLTGMVASDFVVAGGDVGGGGSGKSVFVARAGAVVLGAVDWSDPTATAMRFIEEGQAAGAKVLNYDSIGIGLSVTNDFKRWQDRDKSMEIRPINVGESPDKRRKWPDGKTSAEKFQNRRAELWWLVRDRLQKTWEHVAWVEGDAINGREHPLEELLALPEDPILAAQLSQPTWHPTSVGKIQIESKEDMRRRGVPSPDRADALVLTMDEHFGSVAPHPKVEPLSITRANPFAEFM